MQFKLVCVEDVTHNIFVLDNIARRPAALAPSHNNHTLKGVIPAALDHAMAFVKNERHSFLCVILRIACDISHRCHQLMFSAPTQIGQSGRIDRPLIDSSNLRGTSYQTRANIRLQPERMA